MLYTKPDTFNDLFRDFNDLIHNLNCTHDATHNATHTHVMKDSGDHYSANFIVPGADRDDIKIIKITSQGNILTMTYKAVKGSNPYCRDFSRSWKFVDADLTRTSARYNNGVLTLTVPKAKKPEPTIHTIVVD